MAVGRTFPTSVGGIAGVSPIDAYVDTEIPAAYIETNLSETLNAAMTTMEIVTNCNVVAGGKVQGLNVTVTPGTSSTFGTTACSIYAKMVIPGTTNAISGRTSVIEGRLEIGAGAAMVGNTSVLCLDWSNAQTRGQTGFINSYIMLRDRTFATAGQVQSFIHFQDHVTLPDGGETVGNGVLSDASTDRTSDVRVTCSYGHSLTRFWLLGTKTAPD